MLSKNNQHEQIRKRSQRNYHYAIKNLKIGVFSVAVSVGLSFLGQGAIVQAAELQAADTLPSSATVVDENAKENKNSPVQPEAVHAETPASNTQASNKPAEVQPEAVKPAQTGQADTAQAEATKPAKAEPTAEVQPVSDEKENKVSNAEKAASPQAEKPAKDVAQPEKGEEKSAPKQDAASENSEVRAVNYEGDSAVTYTSLDKVQLPEYAGIFSHDYFNEDKNATTPAAIADFVKEALKDKGLGDDVTYTVDKASFNQALAKTGGPARVENSGDVIVTLKQGNVSKTIKVRALYFRPSYTSWEKDLTKIETPHSKPDKKDYYKKDDHVRSSHSSHNAGKLNVADPNNYTLTEEEKNKIINDFKAVNTNLGLKDPKYSVDDKGNLTITEGDFSTVIPRDYFISNFGFVKDILVFQKEGEKEAYPLTNPIKVPVRNDKEYKDLWGANGTGIKKKGYPSKFKYAIQKDKDGNKFLVLSGTYNNTNNEPRKNGKYEIWGKYGIGSHADKPQDYFQSFTNVYRVRVLRTKNGTIIKNLDTEKITPEELENAAGVDYKKLYALNSPDDPKGTTDAQVRAAVKARITEEFDASGLKHQIGIQNFTGRAIADKHKDSDRFNEENISNEFVATAIYYSEKIKETLVKDPANLNPNEIASIKAKIEERNKALGLSDDDITVDQSGNISIRIKDPNSKEKDGKTTVKFTKSAPLVTASYPVKTVQAGDTETLEITPSKKDDPNYKFPEGTKFELPSGDGVSNPNGLTVDPKTGKITYKAPADAEEKDVEGTINVTLPGEDKPTPIPYLIHVQRPSYANVRYVTSDGKDIDPKFRAEAEDKYPSEIKGKRDTRVIEYAGQKDFSAPKFVGYVFEKPQVNGQNQNFNPQKNATLELVYRKIDEIIPADSGQGKPDGYVKVTFKDVEGGKLDQADADKVYFVNPKAGVKISENGANLVGKDKNGKEQKVALPKVSADDKYKVNYHKPSANETTTWAYDKYDQVGKEITEDKEFTAQVLKQLEPKYKDETGIPGEKVTVKKPNFTDKDNNPTTEPAGTTYERGENAPEGVTVNKDGSLTVKVPEGAKDGDVITVPVKVTYPDGTTDTVEAKVTVKDQSQKVEPAYTPETAKPGETKKVAKPSFTGKDGQKVDEPKDAKYTAPDKDAKDLPKGVTVKEDGTLTVKVPNGAKDGSDIEVPVTVNPDGSLDVKIPENAKDGVEVKVPVKVTYSDGTTDPVNAKVTVVDQSQKVEPAYTPETAKPGETKKVAKPSFTGKDGQKVDEPKDAKYTAPDKDAKDLPKGVTVKEDGTLTVKVPNGAKDGSDIEVPVTVNPDGSLDVKIPENAKDGVEVKVPVKVTYSDGTTDPVNAKVTVVDQSQKVEPAYTPETAKPGETKKVAKPSFTGKDGQKVDEPKDAKYTAPDKDAKDLPKGVTVKEDGTLTVKVPNGAKDGSDIEVPVTVNPDGSLDVKIPENAKDGIEVKVPVKVTYPDDTSDTVDAKVTVVDQSQKVEPAYTPETAKPGETKKVSKPSFTDKDGNPTNEPEKTNYTTPDKDKLPEGVTVKEDGTLTVKVPNGAKDGSDIEVPVTVNPDGSLDVKIPENAKDGVEVKVPVKVTYPDGTSDTVDAKVAVVDQSQKVQPKYDDKTGTPGQEVPVEKPNFTDKDNKPTKVPEGTKYELGKDAPQGVTVNPDGSLSVKVPEGAKDGDVITVPVKVTYPDGTTDTVNAKVTVKDQSQKVEPKYEDKTGTPGQEVPVEKPNFTDKDNKPTKVPEGTKYELGKDAPQGVTVNPDGSLNVKVPEGAKDGDVIAVPVKVTYPDGTTDTVEAKVTVVDQSQKVQPKYDDKTGTPGKEAKVDKPNFTDKDGNPTKTPEGTKYELGKDAPQGVTVNPDGSLSVKVPEGAKDGDVIAVPVKVTYPDGTTDTVEAKVTVVDQSQKVQPKYDDKTGTPGKEAKVEKPNFTDKGGNPTKTPEGAKYELGKDAPQGVTVNPDGSLTVKVPEGAKDGDVITVPVKVTYPDGTTDTVEAKVTVVDQSQKVEPKYGDKTGTPGQEVPVEKPNFTDKDGKTTPAPEGTKYELGKDAPEGVTVHPDGSLTVKVPEGAKDGDVITVPVKVTYPDGTTDTVEAKVTVSDQSQKYTPKPVITLVDDLNKITKEEQDQAVKSLKDFNKDLPKDTVITIDKDGNAIFTYPDGTKDLIEKDKVFAERETTLPPVFDKVKEGDKQISGKTEAFAKVIVTIPGLDKPVEVTADKDGNFLVPVPDGVTLKAKDKITAIAQGKDKKVSKVGEVIVDEIPTSPLPSPSSPKPASPSLEPSHPAAPKTEDNDHPSQETDHSQQPSQTTVTDHSQQAKTDHSTETIAKEDSQSAATASPKLSRVEEKESQTKKAAQTENANTSLPKTGVVAAPVALELLLVAAGAILALPSKRKNK
ncbi:YPDG domain-containing protein [Aerococcus mictus]|uniref:YPDG domain-containing protein n=2 Tax=Aerococcus mictus TaxID=2976810 RepID=A0A9Q4DEA7_9LACT|nr:YPDG domain-containing protein [Aerococcus mictus]MCY3088087.1 YPDG domain-containing protein [Aerococcus mictus]